MSALFDSPCLELFQHLDGGFDYSRSFLREENHHQVLCNLLRGKEVLSDVTEEEADDLSLAFDHSHEGVGIWICALNH